MSKLFVTSDCQHLKKNMYLTLSVSESVTETCSVVLTFESVDEILWCDHSNETSLAVLLHGSICFSIFYKMKFVIFVISGTLASLKVNLLLSPFASRALKKMLSS